MTSVPTHFRS